ncbi:MAG TPA: hypothetical protein VIT91_03585 [Chthoniobacterales bacterium]
MKNLQTIPTFLRNNSSFVIFCSLFLATVTVAEACPVCFSAPDSAETRGMTLAILFLLGTVGIVLCGIAAFFMYLAVRQKEMPVESEWVDEKTTQPVEAEQVIS